MPSLDDVYTQLQNINANLQTIHGDDGLIKSSIDAVKTSVDADTAATNAVRSSVDNAVQQLKLLVVGQIFTNQVLVHLSQQADTMICALEHISKNTCMLLNEAHLQTGFQESIKKNVAALLDIAKTAHPDAAIDLCRREDLREEIEKCCPPQPAAPVCEYRPCPAPPPFREVPPGREQAPPR